MSTADATTIPVGLRQDVQTLWDFHRVDDELRPVDLAVGLGSHDPGVPIYTAELYHRDLFPLIVFTGANAPTTVERFPHGEAAHYRAIAIDHGVPGSAILVEPDATNTGENIDYTRALVAERDISVRAILITCRPYQQLRAYTTAKMHWPEIDVLCSSAPQSLNEHIASIDDAAHVLNMLVGDTQRLTRYAEAGHAIAHEVPADVQAAYERLIDAGYTKRLLPAG